MSVPRHDAHVGHQLPVVEASGVQPGDDGVDFPIALFAVEEHHAHLPAALEVGVVVPRDGLMSCRVQSTRLWPIGESQRSAISPKTSMSAST